LDATLLASPAAAPVETGQTLRVEGDATNPPLNAELTPAAEPEPMLDFGPNAKTLEGVGVPLPRVASDAAPLDADDSHPRELGEEVLGLLDAPAATPAASQPVVATAPDAASAQAPGRVADVDSKKRPTQPPQRERVSPGVSAVSTEKPQNDSVSKVIVRTITAGGIAFAITTWLLLPMFSGDKEGPKPAPAPKLASHEPIATAAPTTSALVVDEMDPPRGLELAPGQGIIEIETAGPEPIYVDDAFVGLGPLRRISAAAGAHSVELRGSAATGALKFTLAAGRRAHVRAAAAVPVAPAPAGSP
jgi:hypothetical protein